MLAQTRESRGGRESSNYGIESKVIANVANQIEKARSEKSKWLIGAWWGQMEGDHVAEREKLGFRL